MTDQKFAEFFAVMMGIFGHKWTLHYGEDATGISAKVWKDGLADLSLQQIAEAIRHYKNRSVSAIWPPSLPEFRAKAIGIPPLAQVRFELRQKQATPFNRILWRYMDSARFAQATYQESDRMTADAYELALAAVMAGEHLPEDTLAIDCDNEARAKAEKAAYDKAHMDRLAELNKTENQQLEPIA